MPPVCRRLSLLFALAALPLPGFASTDFELDATQQDFARYFPTYLANGMFSTQSSLRGTDATLAQMAGLMDYTPDDVSRPAALGLTYFPSLVGSAVLPS